MIEEKKVDFSFLGKELEVTTDLDQDGVKSLRFKLSLTEAYQEALKRGESIQVEGVKAVSLKMDGLKLCIVVDTDKDGESLLEIDVDAMEAIDEATSLGK